MSSDRKVVMIDPKKADSLYEEAIKTLRTNLQFAGRGIHVILVTSCYPNEGKSDVAFQLAQARRVLAPLNYDGSWKKAPPSVLPDT